MRIPMAMAVCMFVVACTPPTTAEKRAEAAAAYEAQQMACVDQYADTAHIDACRDKVKKAWATDAGKDGAP
jgi:hypothetical protein